MATLKKYDFKGKQAGEVSIEDKLLEVAANEQMIKDYIVAIRENARQWSASTKTRSEVCHSGQKPHRQKGLGRARQGCLAAPQYKGGGVALGPRPKFDQHVRINKAERRLAIRFLLAEKIKANNVHVLCGSLEAPKTKAVREFMTAVNLDEKSVLFLLGKSSGNVLKSIRNLPKVKSTPAEQVNGYNLLCCGDIVIMESAVEEILSMLGKGVAE